MEAMKYRSALALAVVTLAGAAQADTVLVSHKLGDHPDGNAADPTYGIRLDNLFTRMTDGGSFLSGSSRSGTTTFSFENNGANMVMDAIDTNNSGEADTLHIHGTVYGGRDVGSGYGFGEGLYEISFMIATGVNTIEGPNGGFQVANASGTDHGYIRSLGNADIAAGTTWSVSNKTNNAGDSFNFLADGHRLGGSSNSALRALNPYVGRGWMMFDGAGGSSGGNQDFLFVTVPLPTGGMLAMAGLGGLAMTRRR